MTTPARPSWSFVAGGAIAPGLVVLDFQPTSCQGAAGCTNPATPSGLCRSCQSIADDAARDAEQEMQR